MSSSDFAIIIPAFNRPKLLLRLLNCLERVNLPANKIADLILSVDGGGDPEVVEIANGFQWKFGQKKVICQETNLKLKNHIFKCGEIGSEYPFFIIIEDDLVLSPFFTDFIFDSSIFYKDQDVVAGISLSSVNLAENSYLPFFSLDMGFDTYFMRIPSSWGQLFTAVQWKKFSDWYLENYQLIDNKPELLPDFVQMWDSTKSWKKYFYYYLISTNRFFVYPRIGFTSNLGEIGTNYVTQMPFFHSELSWGKRQYRFAHSEKTDFYYDENFEIRFSGGFEFFGIPIENIEFDLYGVKGKYKKEFVITLQKSIKPISAFSGQIIPNILNILLGNEGQDFTFSKASDIVFPNTSFDRYEMYHKTRRIYFGESKREQNYSDFFGRKKAILNYLWDSVLNRKKDINYL